MAHGGSDSKEPACNAGVLGLIPGSGRSSGGGHGNPRQYSCLENSMDRGAWRAIVHGVTKNHTQRDSHTERLTLSTLMYCRPNRSASGFSIEPLLNKA